MALFAGLLGGLAKGFLGSAASNLAGNMFGSKRGPQTKLVALRRQAEEAGFNPLTALAATGGQGFNSQFTPSLASQDFVRDSIQTAFDRNTSQAAQEETRRELENDLLKVQIDEVKRGVNAGPFMPRNVPTNGVTSVRSNGQAPGHPLDIAGNPTTPALAMSNRTYETDPGASDAEWWETRYGDIVQNIAGVGVFAQDMWHNRANIGDAIGGAVTDFVETQDAKQEAYDRKKAEEKAEQARRTPAHLYGRKPLSHSGYQRY
jgi:hypothetical protein